MSLPVIDGILDIGGKVIDKIWPDPAEAAKAKAQLIEMQQRGEFKELETRMNAIVTEAKSDDPWTSRARPSFMYVMYAMILAAIPMGIVHAVNPDTAVAISEGMKAWLAAIPEEMWWLFGAGYLGYSTARSADKKNMLKGMGKK